MQLDKFSATDTFLQDPDILILIILKMIDNFSFNSSQNKVDSHIGGRNTQGHDNK